MVFNDRGPARTNGLGRNANRMHGRGAFTWPGISETGFLASSFQLTAWQGQDPIRQEAARHCRLTLNNSPTLRSLTLPEHAFREWHPQTFPPYRYITQQADLRFA
jgi:hypothetical protein